MPQLLTSHSQRLATPQARHLHLPASADGKIALRQHPYAFAYFPDKQVNGHTRELDDVVPLHVRDATSAHCLLHFRQRQSYYRRFVRDVVRLSDAIQCAAARIVAALHRESASSSPTGIEGAFYALHVRRGEFAVMDVKLSAEEILQNLRFPNGTPIVPPGATVYISTDDPRGVCENCRVGRKLCSEYVPPLPVGCPADPSWAAFERFGWRVRFLHDFVATGAG